MIWLVVVELRFLMRLPLLVSEWSFKPTRARPIIEGLSCSTPGHLIHSPIEVRLFRGNAHANPLFCGYAQAMVNIVHILL